MKLATPTRLGLFGLLLTALSTPALSGEGTIPLRMTGRIVGKTQDRFVSGAPVSVDSLRELPPEALRCLKGTPARKFLAQGHVEVHGSVHKILALCLNEALTEIEVFTTDVESQDEIFRIVGRIEQAP